MCFPGRLRPTRTQRCISVQINDTNHHLPRMKGGMNTRTSQSMNGQLSRTSARRSGPQQWRFVIDASMLEIILPTTTDPSGGKSEMIDPTKMKTFTVEYLELSKPNGIWATQSHNQEKLTRASETTDNVYLIFSANKSGEYVGYARMISPITDNEAVTLKAPTCPAPISRSQNNIEMKLTPATATAPQGLIINDSTRGAIFWKMEYSEGENEEHYSNKRVKAPDSPVLEAQSFGRPFGIEWNSTDRVPFCRTRGLRNPDYGLKLPSHCDSAAEL